MSTDSTKQATVKMAQFDPLIISSLAWSLAITLNIYYMISIEILIPDFFGSKKFREKKLSEAVSYGTLKLNTEVMNRLLGSFF